MKTFNVTEEQLGLILEAIASVQESIKFELNTEQEEEDRIRLVNELSNYEDIEILLEK